MKNSKKIMPKSNRKYQVCKCCVMDTTDEDIVFDENGVCMRCNEYKDRILPQWNYGHGHKKELNELVKAIKQIAQEVKEEKIDIQDISEEMISNNLYTKGEPDPDLLIRTSGELRLSNFLPWQLVYSEFLFIEKNWPDFTEEDLDNAIVEYEKRTRKFGAN